MLEQLAIALHKCGAPQHVVSLKGRGVHADALEAAGIPVVDLRMSTSLTAPAGLLRLARLVRRERPDVLQGWMYHGNLLAAFAGKLVRHRARLLWNIRASNMDSARYRRIIGWNARLSPFPEAIISNSQAAVAFHKDYGFRPRHIEIIPNGIDTERYAPNPALRASVREELGISQDAVVAIVVARVDPMKDHANFLEAAAGLPQVQGLLVGADTGALDLPANVRALGYRDDIARLHQVADLIVSSSAFGEGFSNALAEGMSSGLIPVGTNVGDAKLIIGDTGHVVPPREPRALREAIAAEAGRSAEQRRKRGLAARQRVLDHFTLSRAVDAYARLYGLEV